MCVAYYKNIDPKRDKSSPRGIKYAFGGYAPNYKAYRLLNLEFVIEGSNVLLEVMHLTIKHIDF